MKIKTERNIRLPFTRLVAIILISFLNISCHGQNKQQIDNTSSKKPIPVKKHQSFSLYLRDTIPNEKFVQLYYDGQLAQWIRKIFEDSKGNLWFSTNHYGVICFDGNSVKYLMEENGINIGRTNDIVEDKEGNIWIASDGYGLYKYDGKKFSNFTEKQGLINNSVWSIKIDKNNMFWIGTLEGVSKFDGVSKFESFTIPKPKIDKLIPILSKNLISNIIEDKKGSLWFSSDGYGICKYDGKSFTHFTTTEGLADNNIYDLMEDSKGNIWIGTFHGGLSCFDGKDFTNFTKDGLISGEEVSGLFEDKKGNIWFGVENNGVYSYDGKTFTNFNEKDGADVNGIITIYQDKENRFWFGGWKGLFRFDGKTFNPTTKKGPWNK